MGSELLEIPRPRGQQPGKKGHRRTLKPDLPVKDEYIDLFRLKSNYVLNAVNHTSPMEQKIQK